MKRKVVSLFIMTLPLLLAVLLLQLPVFGAPVAQTEPTADDSASAPQQIIIRQQIPVSFTITTPPALTGTVNSTDTGNLLGAIFSSIARSSNLTPTSTMQTVVVTLTLDLQLTVTDTLTSTVPATVSLTLPDQGDGEAPVVVALGQLPLADVVITPLAPLTAAPALTETTAVTTSAEITAGAEVTETASVTTPAAGPTVAITGTVAITANLRSGPDTTFDVAGTTTAGQTVTIVARNADGTWYLLNNGLWLAAILVDNVQGQAPLATEELVTALRAENVITPTAPVTATATVTAATPITPSEPVTATTDVTTTTAPTNTGPILVPTPTAPQPAAQAVQPPRVTVDANLRSGPSITYPIIGGTVTGQEINVVARNGDGSWLRLDNGGWVATFLLANPPISTTVPLFVEEEAPTGDTPATIAAPAPTTTLTGTITATATTTNTTPILGVRENLYTIRVDGIVDGYDFTLNKIDDLVNQAGENVALLQNRAWIVEMTTAITLLRTTSEEVNTLTAPPIFTGAHAILIEAASSFTRAADLLAEGVDQLNTDLLDQAFAEITAGTNRLTRAQNAITAATP
jgi:uncharacterized protein YraI